MYQQLKNPKLYFVIISDLLIFIFAFIASYLLRFEFALEANEIQKMKMLLLWIVPLKMFIFLLFGMYKGMWRYTSLTDLWQLAKASFLSSLLILSAILYANRFEGYSRAIFIIDGILTFLLSGALRLGIRIKYAFSRNSQGTLGKPPMIQRKKCVIVGAGDAGEKMLREINENRFLDYEVVGFIDDDPTKKRRSIHGIRVLGSVDEMQNVLMRNNVQEILIAIPSATGEQMRRIVDACISCNIPHKILPSIGALIDGSVSVKVLRDIRYEDLLGRPVAKLSVEGIRNFLSGKTILVTGCGGSIGSELCRQIIKYNPGFLVLLDSNEANLFFIQMEIENDKSFKNYKTILGRVQNEKLMDSIFSKYKPDVVFHAAAYKHVPMLETNPWEAVFNNILGSRVIMRMAIKYGVEKFVLVSTDKAVRPTSVMGASKRVTELIMQSLQECSISFIAVRFGNVVGSSGSVVPLFRRQIRQGGPVTVTHPEVNRYFMTITEASQMILQAGSMGKGGEIFVLRMGTPVKIADMAKDLIRLSGKEPDVDIKVVYTGLRDGEKLFEELIAEGEDAFPTTHEKVMVLRSNQLFNGASSKLQTKEELDKEINELIKAAECHDAELIKTKLQKIVPEYIPYKNKSVF